MLYKSCELEPEVGAIGDLQELTGCERESPRLRSKAPFSSGYSFTLGAESRAPTRLLMRRIHAKRRARDAFCAGVEGYERSR